MKIASCNRAAVMAKILGLLFVMSLAGHSYAALQNGFYAKKCFSGGSSGGLLFGSTSPATPVDVEQTVRNKVTEAFKSDSTIVAALLRLQFHDCFVTGCDASILLEGPSSERTAPPNLSVRGYDLIETIKQALEAKCPGVVSCADIIAMATRDAVNLASNGVVKYNVQTGRKDGLISLASNVDLPSPSISVDQSIAAFAKKGISPDDMVYLLGGHTVGIAHCALFQDRLYNFQNSGKPDPTMNQTLVEKLKVECPQGSSGGSTVNLDQGPGSSLIVDKSYYQQLLLKSGILQIDQELFLHARTNATVVALTNGAEDFNVKFGEAMVKLGAIIITGARGQIRNTCSKVN
ncbi:hypothetical protein UlMin_012207 [Ulmus minor]